MLLPNTPCTAQRREGTTIVLVQRQQLFTSFYECTEVPSGAPAVFHRSALTPMQTIPARFREHLFAQVAPHLGRALTAWPKAISIDPRPLTLETMRRRLLEAVQSKQKYAWKHASINESLWAEHIDDISVILSDSGVLFLGPRLAVKNKEIVGAVATPAKASPELTLTQPDEIETVCRLLHRKALDPVPVVFLTNMTPELAESLEARYDIAVVPHETDPALYQILT